MGGGVYDSFLEFASTLNYDIILLQETKCSSQTHGRMLSGTSFTRGQTCGRPDHDIPCYHFPELHSFQCLEEGRLLEARFALHDRQDCMFTIFNIYQHAWHDTAGVISKRHHLWTTLSKAVGNTPVRHRLIVAGDFNAPCITKAGLCGAGVLHQEDHQATDVNDLSDIMVTHDLCACNTWRTDVPAHTFKFGALKSQLDFIMVRRTHASIWSYTDTFRSCSIRDKALSYLSALLNHPFRSMTLRCWRTWSKDSSPWVCLSYLCAGAVPMVGTTSATGVEPWSHHVAALLENSGSHIDQQARYFWP